MYVVNQKEGLRMLRGVVIGVLLIIFYCLGSGVYYLVRPRVDATAPMKLARALTWRIALSLGLFVLLFLAYYLGWIQPHRVSF